VLELCAGAAQIGLAATAQTARRLVLVDADPSACHWARRNAERVRPGSLTEVREAPLQDAVAESETFSLILADPPWVATADVGLFPADPPSAIDGGIDGLAVARACVEVIMGHLAPGGAALLQLGSIDQAQSMVSQLADRESPLRCHDSRSFDRGVVVLIAAEDWTC
jgi:methylase of polypeptide subunit release factors